jgi:hypothetical protein
MTSSVSAVGCKPSDANKALLVPNEAHQAWFRHYRPLSGTPQAELFDTDFLF